MERGHNVTQRSQEVSPRRHLSKDLKAVREQVTQSRSATQLVVQRENVGPLFTNY